MSPTPDLTTVSFVTQNKAPNPSRMTKIIDGAWASIFLALTLLIRTSAASATPAILQFFVVHTPLTCPTHLSACTTFPSLQILLISGMLQPKRTGEL